MAKMPTCQAYWKKPPTVHNTAAAPWLRHCRGNLKPAERASRAASGITRHFSLGCMQPRIDGMAERLATGGRRTVKLGRAGPCGPALTASEYCSSDEENRVQESTSLGDSKETGRATVKDDVASVAPEILLDAFSHLLKIKVCCKGLCGLFTS